MSKKSTTRAKLDMWSAVNPLVTALHAEFKELSKKKPDDPLNKRKIAQANRLLGRCREVLCDELSIEFLDVFDEDDVPQNSDAAMMIGQYCAALSQFRADYHRYDGERMENRWFVD